MKIAELRGKTPDELETLLTNLKKESFNLRFQRVTGELANTARVRVVRRTIAQIYTLSSGKNVAPSTASSTKKAKAVKSDKKEVKAEAKKPAAKKKAAKE